MGARLRRARLRRSATGLLSRRLGSSRLSRHAFGAAGLWITVLRPRYPQSSIHALAEARVAAKHERMATLHSTPPPTTHLWWRDVDRPIRLSTFDPIPADDFSVLSLGEQDKGLLVTIQGRVRTADGLSTPELRVAALSTGLPPGSVLIYDTALWIHVGGTPPARTEISHRLRITPPRGVILRRIALPDDATEVIGGREVQSLARAVADVARLRPVPVARRALWEGFARGVTPLTLGVDLETRLGQAAVGRPQARRLIDEVWADYQATAGRVGCA